MCFSARFGRSSEWTFCDGFEGWQYSEQLHSEFTLVYPTVNIAISFYFYAILWVLCKLPASQSKEQCMKGVHCLLGQRPRDQKPPQTWPKVPFRVTSPVTIVQVLESASNPKRISGVYIYIASSRGHPPSVDTKSLKIPMDNGLWFLLISCVLWVDLVFFLLTATFKNQVRRIVSLRPDAKGWVHWAVWKSGWRPNHSKYSTCTDLVWWRSNSKWALKF